MNDHDDEPVLGPVDRMLLECVRTTDAERGRQLDLLCQQHPEHADELRFRLDLLSGVGFLDAAAPPLDAPRDPAPEEPREQIGEFRILRKLGGGGMGEVYLAEQTRLGRQVALKLLRPEFGRSDAARERFRREALALSKLEHPGICPVYEVGEVDGMPYLAMRYLEGRTLADLIRAARDGSRSGCVRLSDSAPKATDESATGADPTSLVAAFEQLARAMHAAHEAGLVHRDVKPQNVIVTGDGTPVIVDFGLVRDTDTDPGLTLSGDVLGTPAYLAPEQIDSSRHADARTDVYALGVTLYECLTLTRPFQGVSREALYRQILAGDCRDVRAHNRQVSKDLAAVVATAMERNLERRYPTALALAEDLRRVRLREPIVARPAGPLLRTWRWAQRNPYLASFVALLVVALLVTTMLLASLDSANTRLDTALTRAQSVALANAAVDVGEKDPKAGLWLALEALGIEESRETRSQVYKMLSRTHEIRRFDARMGQLYDVELSPDGRRLLAAGFHVKIWELDRAGAPRVLHFKDYVQEAAFLGNRGDRVFAGAMSGEWGVWDVPTGQLVYGGEGDAGIWGVDVSPDGRTGLVRRKDEPFLVDLESGRTQSYEHRGICWCGAFSADSELVATAIGTGRGRPPEDVPRTVQVRRVADCGLVHELAHEHKVHGVAFLSGNRLLSVTDEGTSPEDRRGTARIWDLETGVEIQNKSLTLNPWDTEVAITPDGEPIVAIGGAIGAVLWHPDRKIDSPLVAGIALQNGMVASACFAPDGHSLLVGTMHGHAGLYDRYGGMLIDFDGHSGPVWDVDLGTSADGAVAATGSWDQSVRLWRAEDRELTPFGRRRTVHLDVARDGTLLQANERGIAVDGGARVPVSFALSQNRSFAAPRWSPSGQRIVVATDGPGVRIHGRGGELESEVPVPFADFGIGEQSRFVAAFLDEVRVLIVAERGDFASYDAEARSLGPSRQMEREGLGFVTDIAPHPDGTSFAAAGTGLPSTALFDLAGRCLARFPGHLGAVISVSFSADGTRLATASMDKTARVYWTDQPDRQPVMLEGHEGRVTAIGFSPDAQWVVTASDDGTARIWKVADGTEWAAIEPGGLVWDAAFSHDGQWVWTASFLTGVQRWPVDEDELVALASRRSRPDTEVDAERWRAIRDGVLQSR